jgi:hypothetical protein
MKKKEIWDAIRRAGLVARGIGGPKPWDIVSSIIYTDIDKKGKDSEFAKVGKGLFALRGSRSRRVREPFRGPYQFREGSFKYSAHRVLSEKGAPLDPITITDIALREGYLKTGGGTPGATMASQLYADNKKKGAFELVGSFTFALRSWPESKKQPPTLVRSGDHVVGDPLPDPSLGLVYGPCNEEGVVFLFAKLHQRLSQSILVEAVQKGFPDARGRRRTARGWEPVTIEFEYRSSSYKTHGHPLEGCDVIVCWEHDWPECPLEVIELKKELARLSPRVTPDA